MAIKNKEIEIQIMTIIILVFSWFVWFTIHPLSVLWWILPKYWLLIFSVIVFVNTLVTYLYSKNYEYIKMGWAGWTLRISIFLLLFVPYITTEYQEYKEYNEVKALRFDKTEKVNYLLKGLSYETGPIEVKILPIWGTVRKMRTYYC